MLRSAHRGFSLVEMMIAMTIGLMIAAGLVTIFANTSNTQQELRRSSQQIENGRYAMDVLSQDIQVTGYFGSFRKITAPAAAPDPCSLTLIPDLQDSINLPVQTYNAPSLSTAPTLPASCNAYIPASNLSAGSDIVVIRRADTQFVPIGTATPAGQVYGQANPSTMDTM